MDTIPQDVPLKQCHACLEWKPATPEFFRRKAQNSDGLYNPCKVCIRKGKTCRGETVPDGYKRCNKCKQVFLATTEFFQRHSRSNLRGQCRKCQSEYFNSEAGKARHAKEHALHYQRHKEEITSRAKAYRDEHREERNERQRQHYALYREEHQPRYRSYYQKRRALEKSVEGILTAQQIQDKLKAQHFSCYYCFKKFEKRKNGTYVYHLEHTIPLSRKEANPRHDINYVVLSCPHCNNSKNTKLPHEWPEGGRLF